MLQTRIKIITGPIKYFGWPFKISIDRCCMRFKLKFIHLLGLSVDTMNRCLQCDMLLNIFPIDMLYGIGLSKQALPNKKKTQTTSTLFNDYSVLSSRTKQTKELCSCWQLQLAWLVLCAVRIVRRWWRLLVRRIIELFLSVHIGFCVVLQLYAVHGRGDQLLRTVRMSSG